MRTIKSLSIIALILASITAAAETGTGPAQASCVGPYGPGGVQSLQQVLSTAPVIFIGKVVATRNRSRTATVRVGEVWRGKHVSQTVIVRGSYVTGNGATSVDRFFTLGLRYLFVPEPARRSSPFQDNNCTATQPYTAALAQYRPRSAHRP